MIFVWRHIVCGNLLWNPHKTITEIHLLTTQSWRGLPWLSQSQGKHTVQWALCQHLWDTKQRSKHVNFHLTSNLWKCEKNHCLMPGASWGSPMQQVEINISVRCSVFHKSMPIFFDSGRSEKLIHLISFLCEKHISKHLN